MNNVLLKGAEWVVSGKFMCVRIYMRDACFELVSFVLVVVLNNVYKLMKNLV